MDIYLKKVNYNDVDLLFRWANEKEVRENAFSTNKIEYCKHLDWFKNKMEDSNSMIYIAYFKESAVGQIRVDIDNKIGLITYSVDKEFRKKGIGTKILFEIQKKSFVGVQSLVGYVKKENVASIKAFKRAGFSEVIEEKFNRYSLILEKEV